MFCLHSNKHLPCTNHVPLHWLAFQPQTRSWVCGIWKDPKKEEVLKTQGQQGRSVLRLDEGFSEDGMGHTMQGLFGSI